MLNQIGVSWAVEGEDQELDGSILQFVGGTPKTYAVCMTRQGELHSVPLERVRVTALIPSQVPSSDPRQDLEPLLKRATNRPLDERTSPAELYNRVMETSKGISQADAEAIEAVERRAAKDSNKYDPKDLNPYGDAYLPYDPGNDSPTQEGEANDGGPV